MLKGDKRAFYISSFLPLWCAFLLGALLRENNLPLVIFSTLLCLYSIYNIWKTTHPRYSTSPPLKVVHIEKVEFSRLYDYLVVCICGGVVLHHPLEFNLFIFLFIFIMSIQFKMKSKLMMVSPIFTLFEYNIFKVNVTFKNTEKICKDYYLITKRNRYEIPTGVGGMTLHKLERNVYFERNR